MIEDTIEPLELISELQSNAKLTDFREGGIVSRWIRCTSVHESGDQEALEEMRKPFKVTLKNVLKKSGRNLEEIWMKIV
ncbi:CIC11C00000004086 [Sungouiella intermedia]|uniref:CIC11C00000004086 n=1 Tax=Sungouiella intermedia TaxID=45354 RepID=A0A1L0BJ01_9ASCO|nr:CIC11C00000004086 [[Candida] intermedia]